MGGLVQRFGACLLLVICPGSAALAQTLSASSLALRSSGASSGTDWVLDENGYVGTYITLAAPGSVTLGVNASGTSAAGIDPRMNLVVADASIGWDVGAGFQQYEHTFDLPAGTHFLRAEFNNDAEQSARALAIRNLSVSGAAVANVNNNTNALNAADTYIENFRKGPAKLSLGGVAPGSQVQVKLKQHDFHFGTAVGGTTVNGVNSFLNNANYSSFLLEHFNMITPGNAGKWLYNEGTRDVVTMNGVDRLLDFAETNGLGVRMHNMLWGDSQQPNWVNTLLNNANGGNVTAKNDLREEISERIDYYVGDNNPSTTGDRARRYLELDILNEHVHQPKYWNVYGASGMADIFSETASAVAAADAETRLYLNEYNVLQYGFDNYGNWYRRDVDEIVSHGGAISGIGVQYYPFNVTGSNAHSPARIQQIFQNLSVTGLPISLTEFGVQLNNGTTVSQAATYLDQTMRMVFGTPNATTFVIWGFWANDVWNQAPLAALMDANWNLTIAGAAYQQLMAQWDTDLVLEVGPDGTIDFNGFFGKYEITIDGVVHELDLSKGTSLYSLVVAPGDYNGDGIVDAADYAVWRDAVDLAGDLRADGNGDGVVDDNDYDVWKSLFGTIYSSGSASAIGVATVPEPATVVLLILGVPVLFRRC